MNEIQENAGAAKLLTGGVDEFFQRTDANGSLTPLTDALGSVVALVDASGTVQTQYTYDPFGGTSVSGIATGNAAQYTGRENDGTGLYYYRARYYNPALGRFISADPLGFEGSGVNFYSYAGNSPTAIIDPSGLKGRDPDWVGELGKAVGDVAHAVVNGVLGLGKFIGSGGAAAAAWGGVEAGAAAAERYGAPETWGNGGTLERHFADHAADFGATSAEEYANEASQFFQDSQAKGLPTKIDANGIVRVYDPSNNTFGAFNPNGTTRTFFRPTSPTYFQRQPGTVVP